MKRKMLVVDNQPLILRLMTDLLEKQGHEVRTAEDGLSALEILKSYLPDVVFVDMVMPNISGDKLCRIIRGLPEAREVCLVVLSAIAAEEQLDFTAFGANACIAKGPFKQVAVHVTALLDQLETHKTIPGIVGLNGIYEREITKELLSSRKHFQAIINNMTEGVVEITPAGRIIAVNPSASRLLGGEEETILAAAFPDFFSFIHRRRIEDLLRHAGLGPQKVGESAPVLLNDRQVTLHLLSLEEAGRSPSLIMIIRDITELKQNQRDLEIYRHHLEGLVRERNAELLESNRKLREEMEIRQEMEKHLRQIQKMEALGTLAGGMAHDFKNILQIILGHAELIRDAASDNSKILSNLDKIDEAGQRAQQLLFQILTFGRRTGQEREPVQLQQVIEETLSLFAGTIPESIQIRLEIDAHCPPVLADQSQMKQVLFNLITNSCQAMGKKGCLDIALQEMLIKPENARSSELPPGRYVVMTVQDTGHGMKREILDRVFEPYFTTREGEGAGLGLAAVHGIVKSHKGAILASSMPGQGSTFDVFLPPAPEPVH